MWLRGGGKELCFRGHPEDEGLVGLDRWRELGHDRHSLIADPGFPDPAGDDFSLADDSPAFDVGFEPINLSDVGPSARVTVTRTVVRWKTFGSKSASRGPQSS